MNVIKKIIKNLEDRESFCVSTIIESSDSTPRSTVARMIIDENGETQGTIGGGLVEYKVIDKAKELLKKKQSGYFNFNLVSSDIKDGIDMLCGGKVTVLIEFIEPTDLNLSVYKQLNQDLENNVPVILAATVLNLKKENIKITRFLVRNETIFLKEGQISSDISETLINTIKEKKQP